MSERPRAASSAAASGAWPSPSGCRQPVPTTLVERRERPGGRAYVYEDQGFVFDAGPTVITAPGCLDELFELTGRRLADRLEMMPVTPGLRTLIHQGGDQSKILAAARREGMSTLRESGIQKILRGVTTVPEVLRVTMRDVE